MSIDYRFINLAIDYFTYRVSVGGSRGDHLPLTERVKHKFWLIPVGLAATTTTTNAASTTSGLRPPFTSTSSGDAPTPSAF